MARKTKSPEGARNVQLKFYVTKQFSEEVGRFADEHRELGSLGDFGIAAFQFFMQKYSESGFVRDRNGFPVEKASHSTDNEIPAFKSARRHSRSA